jgi:hypothetical protein
MGPATTPQAITGVLTVTPITGIRIGTVGIGDTTIGITIESLASKTSRELVG